MIFNFAINNEQGGTDFGICTAEDEVAAKAFIAAECCVDPADVGVCYGIEELIDQQYSGRAFLTTERC